MKQLASAARISLVRLLAVASLIVGVCRLNVPAVADDVDLFMPIGPVAAPAAAAPEPAIQPAAPADQAKPAAEQKKVAKVSPLDRPIMFPALYPNPLAFNMTWFSFTDRSLLEATVNATQQQVVAGPALQPLANAAAQNAVEQQMRKMLEPMLKAELSFASRAANLNPSERQKLIASSKQWFDKFLVDFIKNCDPNQQQMILQGQQGAWFGGGQPQQVTNPRDSIRVGVAKLVAAKLPKDKATAFATECQKRDEFARQVSIDNMVEQIDEKVKLSPDQWKKITKSLNEHWDKAHVPQLEVFVANENMFPGTPDEWLLPELSPAQQAVLKRINTMSNRVWFGCGFMGGMFGGDNEVIDDIDLQVVEPAAVEKPESPVAK